MRVAAFSLMLSAAAAAPRIPVVLDTDIGTDFDDTWALFWLLARSDVFDLKLVQVSTFNTTKRAQIAAKILSSVGRYDVPIAIGNYTGEQGYPQYAYAENYSLEQFQTEGGTIYHGTEVMAQLLLASNASNPLFRIEIAPATSLGAVLRAYPQAAANVIPVAMSGSIHQGYQNSSTPSIEYNIAKDIAASVLMYTAPWLSPLAIAPTDTTVFDQFYGPIYTMLLAANDTAHPYVSSLLANYVAWYEGGGSTFSAWRPFCPWATSTHAGTETLHDLQAAYHTLAYAQWWAAGRPGALPPFPYFSFDTLQLYIDKQGYTRQAGTGPEPTNPGNTVWSADGFPGGWAQYEADVMEFGAEIVSALIQPASPPS